MPYQELARLMPPAAKVKRRLGMAVALFGIAAAASGCASRSADGPAWFSERVAELKRAPYPVLSEVPNETPNERSEAYWAGVQSELEAVGAAVNASPRAAPAPGTDATTGEFETQARREADSPRPER
jgi:hypothetical protein